jgi:hypothetical protein
MLKLGRNSKLFNFFLFLLVFFFIKIIIVVYFNNGFFIAQEEVINLSNEALVDNDLIDRVKIIFSKAAEILPHVIMRDNALFLKVNNLDKLPDAMNIITLFFGEPTIYVINMVDGCYVITAYY